MSGAEPPRRCRSARVTSVAAPAATAASSSARASSNRPARANKAVSWVREKASRGFQRNGLAQQRLCLPPPLRRLREKLRELGARNGVARVQRHGLAQQRLCLPRRSGVCREAARCAERRRAGPAPWSRAAAPLPRLRRLREKLQAGCAEMRPGSSAMVSRSSASASPRRSGICASSNASWFRGTALRGSSAMVSRSSASASPRRSGICARSCASWLRATASRGSSAMVSRSSASASPRRPGICARSCASWVRGKASRGSSAMLSRSSASASPRRSGVCARSSASWVRACGLRGSRRTDSQPIASAASCAPSAASASRHKDQRYGSKGRHSRPSRASACALRARGRELSPPRLISAVPKAWMVRTKKSARPVAVTKRR